MKDPEWPHLSDVPRDRAAVVAQVHAAAAVKTIAEACTILHRMPGTRFTVAATYPDGTPIDDRYVGLRGSIIAHVATITSPSAAAEEIYAVVYDDPTKAPKFPSTEWWTTSDLPLLSDQWMCTDVKTLPDEFRANFIYPRVQLGAYRKFAQSLGVNVLDFPVSASLDPLKRTNPPQSTDDADRAEI